MLEYLKAVLFGIIAAVLVWMLINAVNCSDGIDGFCGSLSIVSMISVAAAIFMLTQESKPVMLAVIMIFTLSLLLISLKNLIAIAVVMGYASEIKDVFAEPKYSTMEELAEIRKNAGKKKAHRS